MFKKKKRNKKENNKLFEDIKKDDKSLSVDELEQEVNHLMEGYYNLTTLLRSEGIVFRNKDNWKIDLILKDKIQLAMYGLFDYENLPEEIPSYLIEEYLFNGNACFFQLADKYYISSYSIVGDLDVYGKPIHIMPILKNGKTLKKMKVNQDVILLENTFTGLSTYSTIEPFIARCNLNYEISMNNLKMSSVKWLVKVSDEKQLQNVRKEVQDIIDKGGSVGFAHAFGDVEKFPFYEEFNSSEYWEDFNSTLNFIYNLIGVNTNPNEDKKERLIVDEVNINQTKIGLVLEAMFKSRLDFVNKINELFNLDIKLKMYVNYEKGGYNDNEYQNNIIE